MNDIFSLAQNYQFGQLHFKLCQKTGMRAIIAIHNLTRGPALGGCRFIEYTDTDSAIMDAMRLAQGMSYKAAMANLPLGGGKAVIIKPKAPFSREEYMLSFGEFVESLQGQYITGIDSGSELSDMDLVSTKTHFLASRSHDYGDPCPNTAKGVMEGIRAACLFKLGKQNLHGLHMALQGLGHVGLSVAKQLQAEGVRLTVADIDESKYHQLKEVTISNVEDILTTDCDVLVPCALGALLHKSSIPRLNCQAIAGAANNQLLDIEAAYELHARHILFTPDYILNAGGLIYAAGQYLKTPLDEINDQIKSIHSRLIDIFTIAQETNTPPSVLVDKLAMEKMGLGHAKTF